MEYDMEWKGKYKSELLMVCHTDAKAMHGLGIISDKEMRKYDSECLVSPKKPSGNTVASSRPLVPMYAKTSC